MICEQIVNLIRKICCCDAIIIKREKHQKMKIKRNIQKNFKEYSPVSISENENEKIERSCYIPTYVYIILSFILLCFIIYFIIKIYEIVININRVTDINNQIIENEIQEEKNINNTKVCLCTPAKNENRYIREFVEHYEKYGVDKIFLYDNNDIEGEKFDEILRDYIEKGFVEVRDWRGKAKALMQMMNDCYQTNYQIYDWLIFYELDEYIHLSNYTNIKPFLNLPRFKHCEVIYLNLICHTDNNLIYYDNRSLAERFPRTVPKYKKGGYRLEIKSILRGHIPNIEITNNHLLSTDLHNCNGYGNKNRYYYKTYSNQNDYKNYYIDHYYSKSTEEFIEKLNKGDVYLDTLKYVMQRVDKYFTQSEITKEKIDFIENKTGLNLSLYRSKVKK
jgi:hypothetical protein